MEELNLCEILKGHEGETFYNPHYGAVTLSYIGEDYSIFKGVVTDIELFVERNGRVSFTNRLNIFPSKDQRDWNKWIEEQKHKTPKTWSELIEYITPSLFCEIFPKSDGNYITVIEDYGNSLIEKSALALLKIHQLIEFGYGGNVTSEDWQNWRNDKYSIEYNPDINEFEVSPCTYTVSHIAFHTKEQAEGFLSYPENVQLLKDYFMI